MPDVPSSNLCSYSDVPIPNSKLILCFFVCCYLESFLDSRSFLDVRTYPLIWKCQVHIFIGSNFFCIRGTWFRLLKNFRYSSFHFSLKSYDLTACVTPQSFFSEANFANLLSIFYPICFVFSQLTPLLPFIDEIPE